jgi:hypothetical protein
MEDIVYTKDDIKKLSTMVNKDSVLESELVDMNFDPDRFKVYMKKNVPKEYHILFETPLEDIAMMLDERNIQGLINFRFAVGK